MDKRVIVRFNPKSPVQNNLALDSWTYTGDRPTSLNILTPWMSPPILFPADLKLSLERARSDQHDIAAQNAEPLPCFDQFFIR